MILPHSELEVDMPESDGIWYFNYGQLHIINLLVMYNKLLVYIGPLS